MKIATKEDIAVIHHKRLSYGNVVFDLGMESRRDFVKEYFNQRSIIFAGRFGEWDYFWSNQAFLSGVNAVNNVSSTKISCNYLAADSSKLHRLKAFFPARYMQLNPPPNLPQNF